MDKGNLDNLDISNRNSVLLRLIYLWAFVEAGLGGLLHLFHIPITGFVIGGFAVIVNVLIAKYSKNNRTVFIKALGIVLAVKFFLSPYTPFGAYVAVGFQGLLAALIFPFFRLNKVSIFIFTLLVMLESALQKPLMAYFILGKEFWNTSVSVVSDFFKISSKNINIAAFWLFFAYLFVYFLWAILISYWANYIRKNIETFDLDTNKIEKIHFQIQKDTVIGAEKKGKKTAFYFFILAILLLLIFLFFEKLSLFYFLKTLFIVGLLFFIAPILIKKHQAFLFRKNSDIIKDIAKTIPSMKLKTQIAWQLATEYQGLHKIKQFLINTIWLTVFYEKNKQQRIFLSTGAIQTGKSEALLQWSIGKNIGGFVTPTVSEKKVLYDILTGEKTVYQLDEANNNSISVGRYFLDKNAFRVANKIILDAIEAEKEWIVMDEIGKLELNNEGHDATLLFLLNNYDGNIVLVVRDGLLEKVIEKYKIVEPAIIYNIELLIKLTMS